MHTCEIGGVMAYALEFLYTVVTAHVPSDVVRVPNDNFGYGGSPASASYNCNFSAVKSHIFSIRN